MAGWLEALRRERDGYLARGDQDRAAQVEEQIGLIEGAAASRAADPPKPGRARQTRARR